MGWFQQDFNGRYIAFHPGSLPGRTAIIAPVPDQRMAVLVLGGDIDLPYGPVFLTLPGSTIHVDELLKQGLPGTMRRPARTAQHPVEFWKVVKASSPSTRRAAVTVRRPGASRVPVTRTRGSATKPTEQAAKTRAI